MLCECMYGECAHEQHVRRTLTLTHTISAYSISGNVVRVRILIRATRQKPCRKRVYHNSANFNRQDENWDWKNMSTWHKRHDPCFSACQSQQHLPYPNTSSASTPQGANASILGGPNGQLKTTFMKRTSHKHTNPSGNTD